MTVTAVVVSRGNEPGLRRILDNLYSQTRPPDEVLVYCAAYTRKQIVQLAANYRDADFHTHDDIADWGHSARARGLEAASMDLVGFFNDDDSYHDAYLERMVGTLADNDVVFCAWNEQPDCDFHLGQSTAGNFLARTELAQLAGWPADDVYENDGHFIERLNELTGNIVKVPEVIYWHNAQ